METRLTIWIDFDQSQISEVMEAGDNFTQYLAEELGIDSEKIRLFLKENDEAEPAIKN